MTTVKEFYSGEPLLLKNGERLTFQQILRMDNKWMDQCHDFIQWVFPTKTISQHCPNAPVLTKDDAEFIRENHKFLLQTAVERFAAFLNTVDMSKFNHNHLRITRMFESLTLINGECPLNVFLTWSMVYLPQKDYPSPLGRNPITVYDQDTFKFWRNALDSKFD